MLFNSFPFLIFAVLSFALYWLPIGRRETSRGAYQNLILVAASLFFYAYWDWRVLGLFIGTILFTMFMARRLTKLRLIASIIVLLGILGVFKYYNFFVDSFSISASSHHLNLILPLGISFYTFMCISYLVDTKKGLIPHPSTSTSTSTILSTFAYLSFFPQIVAGPIGRGAQMMPQFSTVRQFKYEKGLQGLCLIASGLFKKIVVADTLAVYVSAVFDGNGAYSALAYWVGMIFYTLQIYCDFSGYSDCAIGVGKLFGIDLMTNFDRPYLAKTFSEFWRKWHISLSTWFRDYVYIPLGGSRCTLSRVILNTWIVFLLSGLWHGAAWTFVFWGGLHALYLTGGIFKKRYLVENCIPPPICQVIVFFGVAFAWIFFRASSFSAAFVYLRHMFNFNIIGSLTSVTAPAGGLVFALSILSLALLGLGTLFPKDGRFSSIWKSMLFLVCVIPLIIFLAAPSSPEFIYSQF